MSNYYFKQIENVVNTPLITIGVTCFNAEHTIERALNSALAQDWKNIEVIIVDDASTDSSREILKKKSTEDTRIRVIEHSSNLGCAKARNTLLDAADGEFIAFFDDDDVSRFDRVRLQYDRIIAYEQTTDNRSVICYSSGQRIYANGYVMPIRAVGSDGSPPVGTELVDYLLFNNRNPCVFFGAGTPACSLMARTVLLRDLGGFDDSMRRQEDIDLAIRLGLNGAHFIGIPEPVLTQYATVGSDKNALVEFESSLKLIEKNALYLRHKKCYFYMKLWSELRYRHFAGQDFRAVFVLARLLIAYPFRTAHHFITSATRRFRHERNMNASSSH